VIRLAASPKLYAGGNCLSAFRAAIQPANRARKFQMEANRERRANGQQASNK
jgi:hypothetical protein